MKKSYNERTKRVSSEKQTYHVYYVTGSSSKVKRENIPGVIVASILLL